MSSQLYIGNSSAAPAVIVEKPTPMPLSVQYRKDANGNIIRPNTIMDFDGPVSIGEKGLYFAFYNNELLTGKLDLSKIIYVGKSGCERSFYNCTGITSVDLSSLETIDGNDAFVCCFCNCTSLTSIDFSSLRRINSYNNGLYQAFSGCNLLTAVSFPLLTYAWRYAFCGTFSNCSNLEVVEFPLLETAGYMCFYTTFSDCKKLSSITFPSLKSIDGNCFCYCFSKCTNLVSISFPSLKTTSFGVSYKDQFNSMLQSCSNVTIHFPSNLEPTIQTLTGYPNFGGTETVLLYDLPATE